MNDDKALIEFGRALLSQGMGVEDISDEEAKEATQNWFSSNLSKLKELICGNKGLCAALIEPDAAARNTVITTLADGALSVWLSRIPVPPLTTLNAIAVYGIYRICADRGLDNGS